MDLDFRYFMSDTLKDSSVIDAAITQVFGANSIDMKFKEIGYLLERDFNILNFKCHFDIRALEFHCQVSFEGHSHYLTITEKSMRYEPVTCLVREIVDCVIVKPVDLECVFENENEQAMLDAARDYGFV